MYPGNKKHTEIRELGEIEFVKRITGNFTSENPNTISDHVDDASVINIKKGEYNLLATKLFVEGVHFDLTFFPLQHLGYKTVIASISKIIAMNAVPEQIMVSVGLTNMFSVEMTEEIFQGIKLACENYKLDLADCHITASNKSLVINITSRGSAKAENIIMRKGNQQNDLICISGDLGAAYMGFQVLEREKRVFLQNPEFQPELEAYEDILKRHLKPEARIDVIEMLKELKIRPTSMTNISDGLASALFHICKSSQNACKVFEDKLTFDPKTRETAIEFGLDPAMCVMNGGDDFELLFTININDHEKLKNNPDISVIGHIADESQGYKLISKGGNVYDLKAQGWEAAG